MNSQTDIDGDRAIRSHGQWTTEIVKRSNMAKGFVVLPHSMDADRIDPNAHRRVARYWIYT